MNRHGELPDAQLSMKPPVSGLSDAAPQPPRRARAGGLVVDGDRPRLDPRPDRMRLRLVLGPDRGGEVVPFLVRSPDGFLFILHADDGEHRAERLLPEDGHLLRTPLDHGRRIPERTVLVGPRRVWAAGQHGRASIDCVLHVPFDGLELPIDAERSDLRFGLRLDLPELGEQALLEPIGHGLHHVGPLDRRTGLAGVQERAPQHPGRGRIEVRVLAHDGSVLPSQLHDEGGQVLGSRFGDLPTRRRGPDEADLVARRVDQGRPDLPGSLDHSGHVLGQHGQHLAHQLTAGRRDFRRLQHHRVAGQQRRNERDEREEYGVVPRADAPDHTERTPIDARAQPENRRDQPPDPLRP